jgi:putative PIG3 family NAD(P)H quinone oxidoreductase
MKAIVLKEFGGPEMMSLGEVETPTPGPGQILIRVRATSVNKPDIVQRQGNYHPPKGDSEILGLEVAGIVEEVGEGVTQWQAGQRVMALIGGGGYAEFAIAEAGHGMEIPDAMSFEEAACVCETYLTAFLNLFLLGEMKDGDSALLHGGGGGVNTAAIHLCNNLVPSSPLFVTASAGKVERVKELDVEHVINYQEQSFAGEIKAITEGRGVNLILDHIGAAYLADNMKSLSVYGRLLLIGVTSGIRAELNLAVMMVKRQQIIGSVLRARSKQEKSEIITRFSERVLGLFGEGRIVPLVSGVLPLSDAAAAHKIMQDSGHFGKIVLQVETN